MKFNWGTGIVIAFVAFISFIMYFVVSATTNKKYDYDLVTDDYYKQELGYQNEINNETNSQKTGMEVSLEKTESGLLVTFPKTVNPVNVQGSMFLYRPSDKGMDFEISISLSDSHLLIPNSRLKDGRWNIQVNWTYNGQNYLTKKEITF